MNIPFESAEVAARLLQWYAQQGRNLPWRRDRDPYHIWLSEIMLQQTTVAAVIPYYERFLERFPTLQQLAGASIDEVIALWAGLGYYARARNLHRAAVHIVDELDGRFPDTLETLQALPGIGRSTAGAILSIAFDQPAPILDGNVRRVLVRLLAWQEAPRGSRADRQLWAWATALTPPRRAHDYAQAIMDLGATLCLPRKPLCAACPLNTVCRANELDLAGQLPLRQRKAGIPLRRQLALLVQGPAGVLLRQRPLEGFLGGLWEFPVCDLTPEMERESSARALLRELGLSGPLGYAGQVRHLYSHFRLELQVMSATLAGHDLVCEQGGGRWFASAELDNLPLHGAHRKACSFLNQIAAPLAGRSESG
jgi:A/G-specific adenine glycosylase